MHEHDFIRFPELTNGQMTEFYFSSPHKQILEDFRCRVVKVTDGDTIRVLWEERDFNFPVRLLNIDAPELNEPKGVESKEWLADRIFEEEVDILIDPDNRVEKWGRLLGEVFHDGMNINEEIIRARKAIKWRDRHNVLLPDFKKQMEEFKI